MWYLLLRLAPVNGIDDNSFSNKLQLGLLWLTTDGSVSKFEKIARLRLQWRVTLNGWLPLPDMNRY